MNDHMEICAAVLSRLNFKEWQSIKKVIDNAFKQAMENTKPTVEVLNSEQLEMELGVALQECVSRAAKRALDERQQKFGFNGWSEQ